jgi:pilus assembly protein Flp/PilA
MEKTMRNFLKGLWQDESGAAAAEYALILAIIAIGIALAASNLGVAVSGAIQDASDCIDGTALPAAC